MSDKKCELCGHKICHYPCDNRDSKANRKKKKDCPCKYCTLDRKLGIVLIYTRSL